VWGAVNNHPTYSAARVSSAGKENNTLVSKCSKKKPVLYNNQAAEASDHARGLNHRRERTVKLKAYQSGNGAFRIKSPIE
jgi:hypothetical protein